MQPFKTLNEEPIAQAHFERAIKAEKNFPSLKEKAKKQKKKETYVPTYLELLFI